MNTFKKTPWLLPATLLLIGLFLGHLSATYFSVHQHEAELTSLRASGLEKDQELKATKIALEVAKSKVSVWRELSNETQQDEIAAALP